MHIFSLVGMQSIFSWPFKNKEIEPIALLLLSRMNLEKQFTQSYIDFFQPQFVQLPKAWLYIYILPLPVDLHCMAYGPKTLYYIQFFFIFHPQ